MEPITNFLNAISTLFGFFDPNNTKNVGLRISLLLNAALIILGAIIVVRVEPYVIECGVNKATIQSLERMLNEERGISERRKTRMERLEDYFDEQLPGISK